MLYEGLARAPSDAVLLHEMRRLRLAQGEAGAAGYFLRALCACAEVPDYIALQLVRPCLDAGLPAEAQRLFGEARALDGSLAHAWARVDLARASGDVDRLRKALAALLKAHPDELGARIELGATLSRAGRHEAALRELRSALEAQPQEPSTYFELAHALSALGRRRERAEILLRLVELGHPQVLGEVVADLRAAGDIEGALRVTRTLAQAAPAEAREPESFAHRVARIGALLDLHHADDAGAALDASAAPRDAAQTAVLERLRARQSELTGDLEGARAALERSLEAEATQPEVHLELCRLNLLAVRARDAAAHLEAYMSQDREARALRGEPLSASQTLPGALLNELALDEDAHVALVNIALRPPAERIAPLLALIANAPGSTLAAIQLLLALRLSGQVEIVPAPAEASFVDSFWGDPRSALRAKPVLEESLPPDIARAVRRAPAASGQHILLYATLASRGGVGAIEGTQALAAEPAPVQTGRALDAGIEPFGAIGVERLAAAAGEGVLVRALGESIEAVTRGDADIPWLSTGPGALSRAFAAEMAAHSGDWRDWLSHRRLRVAPTFGR